MKLPVRTLTACAAFVIFIPAGHIAMPAAIFFARFLNSDYTREMRDWLVLGLSACGIILMLVSWRLKSVAAFVGASAALAGSMALATAIWADPFDGIMLLTAIPFLALVGVGFFRALAESTVDN